jgi:hypothetical protein
MRHLAAFVFLKEHPGEYETVRRLLGHKQITTTIAIYADRAENKSALARYDDVVAKHRSAGRPRLRPTKVDFSEGVMSEEDRL